MLDKKLVLILFKNGHSQSKIAKKLSVSRQRIGQVVNNYRTISNINKYKPKFKRHKNSFINKVETLINKGCGVCRNKAQAIHHIDKNSHNNYIKNLLPICLKCHHEIHLGEKTKKIIKTLRKPTWNRKYTECVICKSSKKVYGGYGLCSTCYQRYWYHKKKKQLLANS